MDINQLLKDVSLIAEQINTLVMVNALIIVKYMRHTLMADVNVI